jgi:hypothetical protein
MRDLALVPELPLGITVKLWKSAAAQNRDLETLRHQFVIGPLCESDLCPGKARLYYCYRCKWTFLVCGSKVAVLDEYGKPIIGEESLRRFHTFEEGPCPVLESFASAAVADNVLHPPLRRKSDESVDLASGHISPRPRRLRPVLRVLTGLREDLGRPS